MSEPSVPTDKKPAPKSTPPRPRVLTPTDPRTGEVTGNYALMGTTEISRTVREARSAQKWWSELSFDKRKRWLLDWKKALARRSNELIELLMQETGKPHNDAAIEVMMAIEHLDWAARHAGAVLDDKAPARWSNPTVRSSVGYEPYGVIGVIGPWTYPLMTMMAAATSALAAGNAVVCKPHELTPGVGAWIADSWARLAPNQPVVQMVTGDHTTGAALCRAKIDKVAFIGNSLAARKVLEVCASTLTPAFVMADGKDAMIVHVDARLEDAAAAAVSGSMGNAGQAHTAVERVYVAESVYEPFLELVVAGARKLRPGGNRGASYGPMTREAQVDVIREHIEDALARGGTAVLGGLESIRQPYVEPVILTKVPEESLAVTEPTNGPVLVVNPVADLDEAIARTNASPYALSASIFTRDLPTAQWAARKLNVGFVTINSVQAFFGQPSLPLGGVGLAGHGRIYGEPGLCEFARTKTVVRHVYRARFDAVALDRQPRRLRWQSWRSRRKHSR